MAITKRLSFRKISGLPYLPQLFFHIQLQVEGLSDLFLGQVPSWMLVIGVILAVVGTFVMYWESDSLDESMRDTGGAKDES